MKPCPFSVVILCSDARRMTIDLTAPLSAWRGIKEAGLTITKVRLLPNLGQEFEPDSDELAIYLRDLQAAIGNVPWADNTSVRQWVPRGLILKRGVVTGSRSQWNRLPTNFSREISPVAAALAAALPDDRLNSP